MQLKSNHQEFTLEIHVTLGRVFIPGFSSVKGFSTWDSEGPSLLLQERIFLQRKPNQKKSEPINCVSQMMMIMIMIMITIVIIS